MSSRMVICRVCNSRCARADGRDRYRRAVADFIAGTLPAWDWNSSEGREIDFHAKAQSAQRRTRFPLRSLRLYFREWSMKTRYFISIVLLLALFTQTALGQVSSFRLAQMDGVIQAEIANKKLPGAVVLVGRKGRIIWRKTYGARCRASARTDDGGHDFRSPRASPKSLPLPRAS